MKNTLATRIAVTTMALVLPFGLHFAAVASTGAGLQVSTSATILGIVRSAEGEPLPRVPVSATRLGQDAQGRVTFNAVVSDRGLADTAGSYRFEGLATGRYSISAGTAIPSGATNSGVLEILSGATLTVNFVLPPPATRPRVVQGRIRLNAESLGKPLPEHLAFPNAAVALHTDGTLTGLITPGARRITVVAPNGYFVDTVTAGSASVYSARELGRTPNPIAFSVVVPLEPQPAPEIVITLGTRGSQSNEPRGR